MKSSFALLVAGLTFGATEERPIWHKDWPTAQRIAKRENKPIFAILVCQH